MLLGLIVNELVSNAIKHAFPDGRAGHIRVAFEARDGHLLLSVRDDGIGFRGRNPSDSGRGQELLRDLSQQLGSEPEIKSTRNGTSFRLSIPYVSPSASSRASLAMVT